MMMVMMPVTTLVCFGVAILFVAMLARSFEFKCCVNYSMLCKLFPYGFLDSVGISLGYHVERCIIALPVHAPYVDVMNVIYTVNMAKVLANFIDFDAVRRVLQEKVDGFFEVAKSIDKNEYRDANRHQRID